MAFRPVQCSLCHFEPGLAVFQIEKEEECRGIENSRKYVYYGQKRVARNYDSQGYGQEQIICSFLSVSSAQISINFAFPSM